MASNSEILLMVLSAGRDPWLDIENRGQRPILLANLTEITQQLWISGNSACDSRPVVRLAAQLGKLRMWHYPDSAWIVRRITAWLGRMLSRFLPNARIVLPALRGNLSWRQDAAGPHRVQLDIPTSNFLSPFRMLTNLKWSLENSSYEYLVHITSTCLVNQGPLLKLIASLPARRVYAGVAVTDEFLSGASLIMSRDVVEKIVSLEKHLSHDVYNDVALGRLIKEFNIADVIEFPRLDISSLDEATSVDLTSLRESAIIRCKVQDLTTESQPVIDVFNIVRDRMAWN